ncbi:MULTISPECIES: type II toxin-antitoxin system RelE/ParE family toxin [Pseudomonas]|uniref:Type II toxin-antitoxin system RelE/ParE family toxin n=1 Tax=Pseudomonas nitroreducens TaxID=46680 RepID=A0A6G6IPC6_PSENT|nr:MULTISPECIES: type II toxin-antitoxin system RelE/ParE family toxin [Pseudomonas]MBG6288637.1 type II toxin-antitoxin system RelE/ParE family toxin [Pseudomonas nitroreducens]MCJ1879075.1 type II toxin-antitoxin system RelE/ParE family toxin [Pseudomonas nitroreducens]MCJ1896111.1 type II toxin-antitoxin system RelE/ParE family toxin [Pseudomonas nitroreducens]MDH1071461.1 type II toxin-antitoxin system RelE/ParE family toxin [Pseudomonas nitroreducens]NMZ59965.1 type II toxin-antitoxin sys
MSLQWTHKAAADLDAIYDHYVVLIGPEKALRAIQDIVEQVSPLANLDLSSSGVPSEVPGVRELSVERWPYQAAFRVKGRSVQILRIDRVDNPG